jgi:integrase
VRLIGAETRFDALTDKMIRDYVARRRAEKNPRSGRTVRDPDGTARKVDQRTIRPKTIVNDLQTLETLVNHAREHWPEVAKPQVKVRAQMPKVQNQRERFLSDDEAERILANVVPHARPVLRLALYTGMRRGNILGLDWGDVRLDAPRPFAMVRQKGDRWHTAWLIPPAADLLRQLAPTKTERTGPIFTFANPNVGCTCVWCRRDDMAGKAIKSVRRTFEQARKTAGLPEVRFHDLRHTVASWLLQQGYSLKVVQEVLGHADYKSTLRYAHLEYGAQADAMADALGSRGFGAEFGAKRGSGGEV